MSVINITNFDGKLSPGSDIDLNFIIDNIDINKIPSFLKDDITTKRKHSYISKNINIIDFLGQGSYGVVYKIKIDDTYYAIKLSENEIPHKLVQRYKSLCTNSKLKKHVIKIYCCGELLKKDSEEKFKYYCIMEYGGKTLKSCIDSINVEELRSILKQLYNIVNQACKYRILITDFKLGNLTLTSGNKVKLIDIYMDCKSYTPCTECKIVKTYSTIELDREKRIYESDDYNYTGMYIPLAICLIELICDDTIGHYNNRLCKKFNLDLNVKQMVPLLQIACFNFNNADADCIKQYKNIEKYKKNLESEFKCIKTHDFYEYFLNILEPKEKYIDFISKKKLLLIINDLVTVDPDQRSLKYLKDKLLN